MTGSGDLLADRRYAYAEAAFREGDWDAAAELADQALELAPGFAAGWFLLGQARAARSEAGEARVGTAAELSRQAAQAFERALACDPEDRLGAGLRLARLEAGEPLRAMSPAYVRALFDEYAVRFDRHLVRSLKYRAPELLADAVRRARSLRLDPFRFACALDLGCGTGLAGEVFRPVCRHLSGVDLSPAMIERARAKRLYDDLATGDLVAWLRQRPAGAADLVVAADVLVYLGDLAPLFGEVARVLAAGGLFAFTVQSHPGEAAVLGDDLRYAHGETYLRHLAGRDGLAVILLEPVSTREDRGQPVPGLIAVLAR